MTVLEHRLADATSDSPASGTVDGTAVDELRTRLDRAKHAFSTRSVASHLRRAEELSLLREGHVPAAGEVVLARVVEIGQHKRLESPFSRKAILFEGDEILVSYGSRYAADQFLAIIPGDMGPCHLAAAGGLASRVVDQHEKIDEPTVIEPIGVVADEHGPITLDRVSNHHVVRNITARQDRPGHRVPVIAVLGTSMNSGKSTVLAHLAHGLADAGLRVAAGKATGTGAGNDYNLFIDAGAHRVLDFTDFGYPSTFRVEYDDVRDLFLSMVDELASGAQQPDVVLIEIADGLYQGETARLLADDEFGAVVNTVAFAAGDALGAVGGVTALADLGHTPAFVSGVVTASPLATAESRRALDVPVVPTFELGAGEVASSLLAPVLAER